MAAKKTAGTKAVISLRAYAQHRNVSLTAVQKAIDDGRLSRSVTLVNGVRKIADPHLADQEWEENTDPRKPQSTTGGSEALQKARTIREQYAAATAKLDYEKAIGKVVDAAEVRAAAFTASRKARDKLMTIPDRIAPMFPDIAHQLHTILTEEIERVCRDLANVKGP